MTETARFHLSRWLFLRLLGLIYLLAFASLAPQIVGLIETDELLPIGQYLERARQFYGTPPVHLLPTLLWLSASNTMLNALC